MVEVGFGLEGEREYVRWVEGRLERRKRKFSIGYLITNNYTKNKFENR